MMVNKYMEENNIIKLTIYPGKTIEECLRYCNPDLSEEKIKEVADQYRRLL